MELKEVFFKKFSCRLFRDFLVFLDGSTDSCLACQQYTKITQAMRKQGVPKDQILLILKELCLNIQDCLAFLTNYEEKIIESLENGSNLKEICVDQLKLCNKI
jgi:hypothetical protein